MNKSALLIHDDPEDSAIWAHLLHRLDLDVFTAASKRETTVLLNEQSFQLILVSTSRSQMDTIESCQEIRRKCANPILLLAPRMDEDYILQAYKAGVDDYILTSIAPRIFLAKLRVWLSHAETLRIAEPGKVAAKRLELDSIQKRFRLPDGRAIKLTQLEFRVLDLLMDHPKQVMSADLIINRVWGYSGEDAKIPLKNVVYRLRRKIEPDPAQPRYIQTVPGEGYLYTPS